MFGRKKQIASEQGREGRQVTRGDTPGAFSYYTSRPTESASERHVDRRAFERPTNPFDQSEMVKGRGTPRPWFAVLPFWLLLLVFGVCVVKVLLLSTNPKVIVVGKSAASANYLQSSEVYAAAGHKLLAGSFTNYSKLTANLDGTAKAMQQKFPELQAVSLSAPLVGSRPIMYVQVAQPSLVLQSDYGNYALNAYGVILAKLQSTPEHISTVVDQTSAHPLPGKHYLPGSTVTFTQTVAYQLAAAHLDVNTFVLPARAPYELDVRLNGQQYLIRMNLTADARTQSGAIIAMLQHLGNAVPGEYLDVRTPGRAYYK